MGTPPVAHVEKARFDSMIQGYNLVIRSRDGAKRVKTYGSTMQILGETTFFPVELKEPVQPFVMPGECYGEAVEFFR